jgi:hypothetical protein
MTIPGPVKPLANEIALGWMRQTVPLKPVPAGRAGKGKCHKTGVKGTPTDAQNKNVEFFFWSLTTTLAIKSTSTVLPSIYQ